MTVNETVGLTINQEMVMSKCDRFVDFQLWPLHNRMDPKLWLSNFRDNERQLAVHLLNAFTYYSEPLVDHLFLAAFQNISSIKTGALPTHAARKVAWQHFVDSALITYVTGERPNVTDSGYLFARKTRQLLLINEQQIMEPERALEALTIGASRPVVFVDDFVGSGLQFATTWHRQYTVAGIPTSFAQYAKARGGDFFYCPVFCTEFGLGTISGACPDVRVSPANVLSSRYSAFHPESLVWPPELRQRGINFVREVSARAGIPDDGSVDHWEGFNELGLTLAFNMSVPDATLPLFRWEKNNWKPLIQRS